MHRTTRVPRPAWPLLAFLVLLAGSRSAWAQPTEPKSTVLQVPLNTTKQVQMSTKLPIAEVRNENPKVARVQSLTDDPTRVLVTGLAAGTTQVNLTDIKGNRESFEVAVLSDEIVRREELKKALLETIRKRVPASSIQVEVDPSGVEISGVVTNADDMQAVVGIVRNFGVPPEQITNRIRIGGVQQVQLEVTVAIVNRSEGRNMAFSWFNNRNSYFVNSILQTPVSAASILAPGINAATAGLTGNPNLSFGVIDNRNGFTGFLQALRAEGLTKILAEPRVVTLSGRPAYVVSGGETPILTSSGQGAPTVSYKQFGTVVNFLPIVLDDGRIHLEVRPELSNINNANSITIAGVTPTVVPGFDTRSAQVAVQMEDGQTLAIGGLIQNRINANTSKVPILGDLPFFGAGFRTVSYTEIEEEMIILVTPRLVAPMACTQIPKYLPGRETRPADDFELFLEGIMEAPRGQRDVCFLNGCGYQAAHAGAGAYPCGDTSSSHLGRLLGHRGCGLAGCGTTGCSNGCGLGYGTVSGSCTNGSCAGKGCSGVITGGHTSLPQDSSVVVTGAERMPGGPVQETHAVVVETVVEPGNLPPATSPAQALPTQAMPAPAATPPALPPTEISRPLEMPR